MVTLANDPAALLAFLSASPEGRQVLSGAGGLHALLYQMTTQPVTEAQRRAMDVVLRGAVERYFKTWTVSPEVQLENIRRHDWGGRYVGFWHLHPPRLSAGAYAPSIEPSAGGPRHRAREGTAPHLRVPAGRVRHVRPRAHRRIRHGGIVPGPRRAPPLRCLGEPVPQARALSRKDLATGSATCPGSPSPVLAARVESARCASLSPSRRWPRLVLPRPALAQNPAVTVNVNATANRRAISDDVYGLAFADTVRAHGPADLAQSVGRQPHYPLQLAAQRGQPRGRLVLPEHRLRRRHSRRRSRRLHRGQPRGRRRADDDDPHGRMGGEGRPGPRQAGQLLDREVRSAAGRRLADGCRTPATASGRTASSSRATIRATRTCPPTRPSTRAGSPTWSTAGARPPRAACATTSSTTSPASGTRRTATCIPKAPDMEEVRDKMIAYASAIKDVDPERQGRGTRGVGLVRLPLQRLRPAIRLRARLGIPAGPRRPRQPGLHALAPEPAPPGGSHVRPAAARRVHRCTTTRRAASSETTRPPPMQQRRNRSTRSLWDPNYTDETWINDKVRLIPRLREWVDTHYPGTPIGITEYNWGAEGHINGATTQADVLGIFGREGLDLAARWTTPDPASLTYAAIKMYRNYDNLGSGFGETSVGRGRAQPRQPVRVRLVALVGRRPHGDGDQQGAHGRHAAHREPRELPVGGRRAGLAAALDRRHPAPVGPRGRERATRHHRARAEHHALRRAAVRPDLQGRPGVGQRRRLVLVRERRGPRP